MSLRKLFSILSLLPFLLAWTPQSPMDHLCPPDKIQDNKCTLYRLQLIYHEDVNFQLDASLILDNVQIKCYLKETQEPCAIMIRSSHGQITLKNTSKSHGSAVVLEAPLREVTLFDTSAIITTG